MPKTNHIPDKSTEEKIKAAARKLFTHNGFAAVKTRDIAAEAGINIALLNYYFRSKQKLFDIIMLENIHQFVEGLAPMLGDETKTFEEKIEILACTYIDMLLQNPDLPLFVLNEMSSPSSTFPTKLSTISPFREVFIRQFKEGIKSGKYAPIHPSHLMANLMGLIIFPFAARPMLFRVGHLDLKQFDALMQERKKMIPVWLQAMLKAK